MLKKNKILITPSLDDHENFKTKIRDIWAVLLAIRAL